MVIVGLATPPVVKLAQKETKTKLPSLKYLAKATFTAEMVIELEIVGS
jgi:hypothetical protein